MLTSRWIFQASLELFSCFPEVLLSFKSLNRPPLNAYALRVELSVRSALLLPSEWLWWILEVLLFQVNLVNALLLRRLYLHNWRLWAFMLNIFLIFSIRCFLIDCDPVVNFIRDIADIIICNGRGDGDLRVWLAYHAFFLKLAHAALVLKLLLARPAENSRTGPDLAIVIKRPWVLMLMFKAATWAGRCFILEEICHLRLVWVVQISDLVSILICLLRKSQQLGLILLLWWVVWVVWWAWATLDQTHFFE